MPGGVFVSFEGGEGSGKTTQARILRDHLVKEGFPATLVHEPGSTELGWYLSRYLKGEHQLSKEAELLLFVAARVELVKDVIRPCLEQGRSVVADRFSDSTMAYQGYGRKISLEAIQSINSFATGNVTPDITFLLDIEPKEGLRLVGQPQLRLPLESPLEGTLGRQDMEGQRRFEDQPLDFHNRVREGYLKLAKQDPRRWIIIDARSPTQEVSEQVWGSVVPLLAEPPAKSRGIT